jgi:hypothetical protein
MCGLRKTGEHRTQFVAELRSVLSLSLVSV